MIDTERERARERKREAEEEAGSMHREPDVGFDPGSPGSCPGPKSGAKPLRHPGIPIFCPFLKLCFLLICRSYLYILYTGLLLAIFTTVIFSYSVACLFTFNGDSEKSVFIFNVVQFNKFSLSLRVFFMSFFKNLFMRDTQRERQRHRQREKQAPYREPHVGLDPGTPP